MITWSYTLAYSGSDTSSGSSSSVDSGSGALSQTPGLAYACLALDPVTWDVALPVRILRGADAVVQTIKVRFRWFLGEWFLDRREGVPYRESILVKNPDPVLISGIYRRVLLSTPGVARVESFQATLDTPSRTLTVDFVAVLDNGAQVTATAEPFIV